jgi:hypothetical protein
MTRIILLACISLCFIWSGCPGSPKDTKQTQKDTPKGTESRTSPQGNEEIVKGCTKLDVKNQCKGTADLEHACYFDEAKGACAAKEALRFSKVDITSSSLMGITKDGYLFTQNANTATLKDKKIIGLAASNFPDGEYCVIESDNVLACPVNTNLASIPANIKAKQIAMGPSNTICYIDMADKIGCIGKSQVPQPEFGSAWEMGFVQKDLRTEVFASVKVGHYHACGIITATDKTKNMWCLSDTPAAKTQLYLGNWRDIIDFALSAGITYHIDSSNKLKISNASIIDLTKFISQGSKAFDSDINKLSLTRLSVGAFFDKTRTQHYELLCAIAKDDKVYCGSLAAGNSLLDLRKFNPIKPTEVFVNNNAICALDKDGLLHCANVGGDSADARLLGFSAP